MDNSSAKNPHGHLFLNPECDLVSFPPEPRESDLVQSYQYLMTSVQALANGVEKRRKASTLPQQTAEWEHAVIHTRGAWQNLQRALLCLFATNLPEDPWPK